MQGNYGKTGCLYVCIYLADNDALVHEHAERSGFPATIVTEVRKMIDPVTAEG